LYKKQTGFLLVVIFLVISMCGCQAPERRPLETQPQEQTGLTASDRRVLADHLSRMATEVEGVQKATVVISDITLANDSGEGTNTSGNNTSGNNTAADASSDISGMIVMVGISINDQVNDEKTKTDVKNKLRASDKRISQVLVTSDPELVKKINDVAAGIIKGEPINKFETDLKQMGKQFKNNDPAF